MVTFVIGGARSGKSGFALNTASGVSGRKAYIATAQALDDEMLERVRRHKNERPDDWTTFEEPLNIAGLARDIRGSFDVVLIDCLTLWLSNLMPKQNGEIEEATEDFLDALGRFREGPSHMFIVSNEVGLGIVPDNPVARRFRDMAGLLNRQIAKASDEVFLVTAGIPLKIK